MGDFAEKLYWVVKGRFSSIPCTLTIENINTTLDEIVQRHAENRTKDEVFARLIKSLGPTELMWLTRTILKDVKLGIGQKKIFQAYHPYADNYFGEKSNLRELCDALWDPNHRVEKLTSSITVLAPFRPMLLERCRIEETGKFFDDNQTRAYLVQTKYDGERIQVHKKDDKFKYYTRHGTDITNNWAYGESKDSGGPLTTKIASHLDPDCRSIVLDGELMGWHKDRKTFGSKAMPYDVKKLTANSRHQPCFVAFDIVSYNDRSLLDVPLCERLEILSKTFREAEGFFIKSVVTLITSRAQLLEIFNKSLDAKEEGIVLKRSDGLYKLNTRNGSGCYKIKAEYSEDLIQDLDLLILGGYYGEGKYSGMFSTFLVGVAVDNDDSKTKKFYSVGSVSTGLGMEKLKELQTILKPHWIKQCPKNVVGPKQKKSPDAWICPNNSLILQLRATELTRCSVHPTGYTLRFPRVVRVRDDKPWEDAWTLNEFRAIIKDGSFVQKATKRHATDKDIWEVAPPKTPRNVKLAPMRIDAKYLGVRTSYVSRLTRLFQGKEFCVINGEENLPKCNGLAKADIERILHSHSAKIVQNPGDNTFAIVAGNRKTERVKNLVNEGKWDIVTVSWLQRVTEEKNWHCDDDWFPWEIISASESTKKRLSESYDRFNDNYTKDADSESLARSFERVEIIQKENPEAIDVRHEEIEEELFDDSISPFSLFRNLFGYFDDPADTRIWLFTFMRGRISEVIDRTVTHVFVNGNAANLIDLYKKINRGGKVETKIMNGTWIEDCFKSEKLLPDHGYIIA